MQAQMTSVRKHQKSWKSDFLHLFGQLKTSLGNIYWPDSIQVGWGQNFYPKKSYTMSHTWPFPFRQSKHVQVAAIHSLWPVPPLWFLLFFSCGSSNSNSSNPLIPNTSLHKRSTISFGFMNPPYNTAMIPACVTSRANRPFFKSNLKSSNSFKEHNLIRHGVNFNNLVCIPESTDCFQPL